VRKGWVRDRLHHAGWTIFLTFYSIFLLQPFKVWHIYSILSQRSTTGTRRYQHQRPGFIMRLLTAHPRWGSEFHLGNALIVGFIIVMLVYGPPLNLAWTIGVTAALAGSGIAAALITMRDIYVHVMARELVSYPENFRMAIRNVDFSNWLYLNMHEDIVSLLESREVADFTADERYWLAAHHERFMLSHLCGDDGKLRPLLFGAMLFGLKFTPWYK
jgi:hypothetical protein